MFVPVVDEETPRSEREKKKKGEKENAHSRFHRTHDKSGETFGSSDVDFREEEQMMDFLREDASKTMPPSPATLSVSTPLGVGEAIGE